MPPDLAPASPAPAPLKAEGGAGTRALRILLLAAGGNPDAISSALVAYSHSEALARRHSVTLLTHARNEPAIRRTQAPFTAIEAISMRLLDRLYDLGFRHLFKNDFTSQALTAFSYPFCLAFEWHAWRRMRRRIAAGEFDLVLRLTPITAVLPSVFSYCLRRGPIPFVIGPVNGGLPWPEGFSQAATTREWLSGLRGLHKAMPFARSTYRRAAAIVAGSSHTYRELAGYGDKVFFVPENGINASLCADPSQALARHDRLELLFVGGLVPIKACDLALRGAAPLLKRNAARFTVVGDGPERQRLQRLATSLGIERAVSFRGMLPHADAMRCMRAADVLVFPSIRDFGGAVVFEAMAAGTVPIVTDFGGPGDIVRPEFGFKVPLTSEADIVSRIAGILETLAGDAALLDRLKEEGIRHARASYTWDQKVAAMTDVMNWALGRSPKPHLPCPTPAAAVRDAMN